MSFLFPSVLWLLIPIGLFLAKSSHKIMIKAHLSILLLLILAFARPVQEKGLQKVETQAQEIIIALDVSRSMHASDLSPTRYKFAKETIKHFLALRPLDNIMLIAFTSNPLLLSPPSTDSTLINVALENFNPDFILTKGTSLKKLFKKVTSLHKNHTSLILLTDGGEEDERAPLVDLLHKADISLVTLALGSIQGTTILKENGTLLKDKEGNLVVSRINPLLKHLTNSVNGTYLTASSTPETTAKELNTAIASSSKLQNIEKVTQHYLELYQIPLLLAALLFLLLHTRSVKYLIFIFTFFGFQVQASIFDTYYLHQASQAYTQQDFNKSQNYLNKIEIPSLESTVALANNYYQAHNFKKAIQTYKSIQSTSAPIKQQLYYNIANAYAQLGIYSKAKLYYTKALKLGLDEDALFNLHIVTLLHDKNAASLGIAHPKSQSASSSQSESKKQDKTRDEDQPSSSSGASGAQQDKENKHKKTKEKTKLIYDGTFQKQPLSSKVYELINKGYIHETQPW